MWPPATLGIGNESSISNSGNYTVSVELSGSSDRGIGCTGDHQQSRASPSRSLGRRVPHVATRWRLVVVIPGVATPTYPCYEQRPVLFFAPNLSLPVSVAASPQWSTSAPCPSGSGTCARRQRKLRRPSPSAWPRYVSAPHVCRHVSAPVRHCVVSRSPTGRPLTPACGGSVRVVRAGPLDGGAESPPPVHHSCRMKLSTNGYPWLSLLCCPLPPCPPPPTRAARSV